MRIALNLKACDYVRHDISLVEGQQRSPEHLARNPQGYVPALDIGEAVLTQSLAIVEWLDATFPEPRLIPAEPLARARTMAQALLIACDIHPLNNLGVLRRLKDQFDADQAGRDDWYRHWVTQGFTALEAQAGDGAYLGGDAPGIADVFLVPQMFNARRLETPLEAFPKLVAIDARACAIPAFAAAHPDRVGPDLP
ncbi:maleylacetoacetate isomerase [Sphingomonas japonica]